MSTPNWRRLIGIGRIVETMPPGVTACKNGNFSTFKMGRGVCSYNGGVIISKTLAKTVPFASPKLVINKAGLIANFEQLAQEIASQNTSERAGVKVTNWKDRRLYINYENYPKSARDGGFIDLFNGYINYPTKGQGTSQKERKQLLDKIKSKIFIL